ncbi:transport particle complex subunit [Pyrrhoderma noxium]|uniref:Trafficking protein particle complex subunit n=1 Tax=Pyrrhoderma noxium TaxID=2282107 RepID=A0A286UWF4_9AGAM|nr:transport particle complex subunit [Pyrrhoderma noxium]
MVVFGLWVINKAGGLVYQRNFADGLAQLSSNEYLVLAGTLHGVHAITSRLSPAGPSSGAQVIEAETFKMTILLTATGTKFVLLTSLHDVNAESLLQKVYEAYADMGMKNPFHTPEMPIRSDKFDSRIGALLGANPST